MLAGRCLRKVVRSFESSNPWVTQKSSKVILKSDLMQVSCADKNVLCQFVSKFYVSLWVNVPMSWTPKYVCNIQNNKIHSKRKIIIRVVEEQARISNFNLLIDPIIFVQPPPAKKNIIFPTKIFYQSHLTSTWLYK